MERNSDRRGGTCVEAAPNCGFDAGRIGTVSNVSTTVERAVVRPAATIKVGLVAGMFADLYVFGDRTPPPDSAGANV
jgi:hypothetical protein